MVVQSPPAQSAAPSPSTDATPQITMGCKALEPDPPFVKALDALAEYAREERADSTAQLRMVAGELDPSMNHKERMQALLTEARRQLDVVVSRSNKGLRQPGARRLVNAYCLRKLNPGSAPSGKPPAGVVRDDQTLGTLEEIGYAYVLGPGTDPTRFLGYCKECYAGDPQRDEVYKQLLKGFLGQRRCESLASSVSRLCPPLRGKNAADVGCGLGPLLPYLLEQTGPTGQVWGEDIDATLLDFIRYAATHGMPALQRAHLLLGQHEDVMLEAGAMDAVFLVQTLHCVENDLNEDERITGLTVKWLRSIRRAMRPNAVLIIVEDGRHITPRFARKLLTQAGFVEDANIMSAETGEIGEGSTTGFILRERVAHKGGR